jgi:dipeptidyl aminopeptidase/acylaminoacyl peptidase
MDDATAMRHHRGMLKSRVERAALLLALVASIARANGVDVRDFAHSPQFSYATLSPNGTRVSYVDQIDSRQTVFIRELDKSLVKPTLRVQPPEERIRWCGWADIRWLLCGTTLTARKPHALVESTRLYAVDAITSQVREVNARVESGARDSVIDLMPNIPERVLLQLDLDRRGFPEVVDLNVATGQIRTVVRAQPPVRSWMSNGRGEVGLGLAYEDQTATLFIRKAASGEWRALIRQSLVDPDAIGPLAFGATNSELYVLKHHRGRAAIFRLQLEQPTKPQLVFADPMFDVGGPLVIHSQTRELLAVHYQAEAPAVRFFSDQEKERHAWLDGALPNVWNEVIARSLDDAHLLIRSSSDTNPPSFYLAESKGQRLQLLGHAFPQLEARSFVEMQPMMYAARDGQRIPAYLSRPTNRSTPGPAIVLPHGGPETRNVRQFDPLVQFFVARGYSVLQMNFRGSLGYGAGFAAAGARQWGGVIHNDITDGARWLVEQTIADPERLCIVGSSFGGYAALLGAARESQWYACAASFAGTSDLMAFNEYTQRLPDAAMWRERLGDDARALWQMSPLAMAWRIETPTLLMHGRRDAVVPISQSRRLARDLRTAGKPHELIERSDCDHDMTADSCRLAIFAAIDRFLDETLASE